ncbi:hypothetical protein GT022_18615 [Agaribacter marinus]|uniref:Uncharacterized protein n=1 Tax=Virgibacillus salarius TaxID=447199 RepID=A0A941ID04_9BACI|nr:hypothetical protein [Virgibacillus salarius]MBR7798046.1 hypothetical protein [Virgibacillus salarius]NAZ10755.1 hypothetical protein [Agaribacter marinus]
MYKKIIMFSLLAAVIVFFIYWFYPFKPSVFLSDEQIALEIEEVIFKSNVKQVQDVIKIDERHFFVPFITENQTYSGSYWEWKRNQWKLNWVKINLRPRVLKIEENNPETYYFVWNLDPRDQVAALDFFLKKKRGYSGTNYHPAIQMKDEISLDTSSYGIRKLPIGKA